MSSNSFGVSRVWIGEISDPPQYLSLLAQRIATLGGSYRDVFKIRFETLRFKDRHIAFFGKHCDKSTAKPLPKSNAHHYQEDSVSMISALFSVSNSMQNTRVVPKHCLSVFQHSKHNESQFALFENHVLSAADLLTSQLIDPFKLNKKSKAIFVNGECYQWGDFLIYFGQISKHSSPADFVIVEIEYQCCHSLSNGNTSRILQEIFHWIITPIPKTIGSSQRVIATQTELEKTMDIDSGSKDDEKEKDRGKEMSDVFVELSNEKGEKIKWKAQSPVDFSTLDITTSAFDGRHLAVLYCSAFSKIQD